MGMPSMYVDLKSSTDFHRHPERQAEVCLGAMETIPLGQGRSFTFGSSQIAIFRMRNGDLRAIDNECPHRGGPLAEGLAGDGVVVCPFHAWKFDLKSGACMNDPISLQTYPVREIAGQIFLTLPGS